MVLGSFPRCIFDNGEQSGYYPYKSYRVRGRRLDPTLVASREL